MPQILEKQEEGPFVPKEGFIYTLGVAPIRLINGVPYVYVFRQAAGQVKRSWGIVPRKREVKLIGGNWSRSKDLNWVDVVVRESREEGQIVIYPTQIADTQYRSFKTGQAQPGEEKLGEHRYVLFLAMLENEPPRIVVDERSEEAEYVEETNWVALDDFLNPRWRWKGAPVNSAHRERMEALKNKFYELIYGKPRQRRSEKQNQKTDEVDWLKSA